MSINDNYDDLDELPPRPRQSIPAADRELLHLAARAIGAVQVDDINGELWLSLHFADGTVVHGWNALLFYSDTFELASRLGLLVDFSSRTDADPAAATARAVVRAAAEIGKTK